MRAASLRTVLVIEIALVLSACGSATPAPAGETGGEQVEGGGDGDGDGAGGSTNDRSADDVVVAAGAARCPERYGTAPPSCDAADDPGRCTYPEGTCGCQVPVWCGGAAPPPMPPMWICEEVSAGCPAAGSPCTGTGTCASGPCGRHQVVCADGVWTPVPVQYPPAAAPRL